MEDRNFPEEGVLLIGYFEVRDKDGRPVRRYVHGPVTDLITSQYLLREAEAQMLANLLNLGVHVMPAPGIVAGADPAAVGSDPAAPTGETRPTL